MSTPRRAGRNRRTRTTSRILLAVVCVAGCGDREPDADRSDTTRSGTTPAASAEPAVRRVPDDHPTIQEAVDASQPGDTILIAPGTYPESVTVETEDLVIRGLDRARVVLDGNDTLENGFFVLADRVAVENLTVTRFRGNGALWAGDYQATSGFLTGFRAHAITALNNGIYGIYTFAAQGGTVTDVYASGHPDAGIYVGQCQPCDTFVAGNTVEHNVVGIQMANAGGNLVIGANTIRENRIGIEPTSTAKEQLAPQTGASIIANRIVDSGKGPTPTSRKLAGYGIGLGGAQDNTIERNLITGSAAGGIALAPNETFATSGNVISGNTLTGNLIDLLYLVPGGAPSNNCMSGNTFTTSSPPDIETALACPGGPGGAGSAPNPAIEPGMDYTQVPPPGTPPSGLAHPEDDIQRVSTNTTFDLDSLTVPQ